MDELERRSWPECRIMADESGKMMRGYAIRFNSLSLDLGGFRELIAPEAVDRTLQEAADVRALVNHDSGKVIGRTRAGTLELRKDSQGLAVKIEPDLGISYASDIMKAVARGDVSGMSFGFRVVEDTWNWETDPPTRTIMDMKVSEVSVVTFPAYPATDIQVALRSLNAAHPMAHRSVRWLKKWHQVQIAK
jgi:HK97 family phage prohead protease